MRRSTLPPWPDPNVTPWSANDTASWTDYNGMMPYLDFDLSSDVNDHAVVDEATRYLAGMGIAARQDDATSADEFLHGDLIRSTVMTTDESGTVAATVSYTAFGQLVTSSGIGPRKGPRKGVRLEWHCRGFSVSDGGCVGAPRRTLTGETRAGG